MERIRDAIIRQAVDDYKDLVNGIIKKPTARCNLNELKAFFESEYCNNLLSDVSITGPQILASLEEYKFYAYRRRLREAHKELVRNGSMEEARLILRLLLEGCVFLTPDGSDSRVVGILGRIGVDMVANKRGCAVASLKYDPKINKNRPPEFTFIP